jgi:hypothetical protein
MGKSTKTRKIVKIRFSSEGIFGVFGVPTEGVYTGPIGVWRPVGSPKTACIY